MNRQKHIQFGTVRSCPVAAANAQVDCQEFPKVQELHFVGKTGKFIIIFAGLQCTKTQQSEHMLAQQFQTEASVNTQQH